MPLIIFRHCIYITLATIFIWPLYGKSTQLSIPDYPLFLTAAGVPPNIILTLDDSGSMGRAFAPDLCDGGRDSSGRGNSFSCVWLDDRFAKSSAGNSMYYNPKVAYLAPSKEDDTLYSTSFKSAHINGYDPDRTYNDDYYGAIINPNLSNNYRPTSTRFFSIGPLAPNGNGYGIPDHNFMSHYSQDVSCRSRRCQVSNGSGGWSTAGIQSCKIDSECVIKGVPAYYYVLKNTCDPSGNPYDVASDIRNNNCYEIKIVGNQKGPADLNNDGVVNEDDERQNFANWYSFYRVRTLSAIGSTLRLFSTLNTDQTKAPRVAWQDLNNCSARGVFSGNAIIESGDKSDFVTNNCNGWDGTVGAISNEIKPFSGAHRSKFYSWIARLPSKGGTRLRMALIQVGRYFSTSGNDSPYDDDLLSSNAKESSCRRNYHIMVTDGLWGGEGALEIGNLDKNAPKPYTDDNSTSLADIAYYYWKTDLRPDLDNKIAPSIIKYYSDKASCSPDSPSFVYPPPASCEQFWDAQNNPQTRQHLVNYMIGFGLSGFLKAASIDFDYDRGATEPTYSGSYFDLKNGTKKWPITGANLAGNVADLWHAALNSRGKFYSANSPDDVVNAFQKILSSISAQASAGGGARAASSVVRLSEAYPTTFLARFNDDWSGTLEALPLDTKGTLGTTHYWEAGSLIPPGNGNLRASPRSIFTYLFTDINKSIASASAKEFIANNICTGINTLSIVLNSDHNRPLAKVRIVPILGA